MAPLDQRRQWDPRKILGLYPLAENFTCVGAAVSKGNSRCGLKISLGAREAASTILNSMDEEMGPVTPDDVLLRLAKLLLCQNYHQCQANEKTQEWSAKITEATQEFLAWFELETTIQVLEDDKEDMEISMERLKQESAAQSRRANRAIDQAKKLKTMLEDLISQRSDLQSAHDTLQKEFEELQEDQIETKEKKKALSKKFSATKKAAKERETELVEKLSTAKQVAKKREAKLTEKFSNTKQAAKKKESELTERLSTAEQVAKKREAEFTQKLSTAEQAAKERESDLTEKLSTAEQSAKERESELMEKLTRSETILEQSQQTNLQLEFQAQTQYTTTKHEAHVKHIAAQASIILLLQTELSAQQSKLKEKKKKKTQSQLRDDRDESIISDTPESTIYTPESSIIEATPKREEEDDEEEERESSSERVDALDTVATYIRQLR